MSIDLDKIQYATTVSSLKNFDSVQEVDITVSGTVAAGSATTWQGSVAIDKGLALTQAIFDVDDSGTWEPTPPITFKTFVEGPNNISYNILIEHSDNLVTIKLRHFNSSSAPNTVQTRTFTFRLAFFLSDF